MNTNTLMNTAELKFEASRMSSEGEVSESRFEAAEAHARRSKTLQALIYGWASGEQTVRLCAGSSDEDNRPGYFAVLAHGPDELVSVWLEPSELRAAYPAVRPFKPNDESYFREMEFDDDIGDLVTSYERLLELAISFLLTGHGDITFHELREDSLSDVIESEETFRRFEFAKVVWADLALLSDDGMRSEHWTVHVVEENGRPDRVL